MPRIAYVSSLGHLEMTPEYLGELGTVEKFCTGILAVEGISASSFDMVVMQDHLLYQDPAPVRSTHPALPEAELHSMYDVGIAVLEYVRKTQPNVPVIVLERFPKNSPVWNESLEPNHARVRSLAHALLEQDPDEALLLSQGRRLLNT